MAKSRDAAKERYWREIVRRQQASGLGTKRFCSREGVPEHRFYWWRRTLRRRQEQGVHRRGHPRDKHRSQEVKGSGLQNSSTVGKTGSAGRVESGQRVLEGSGGPARSHGRLDDHSAFLPVTLPLSLGASIEVVHPRGHVVRIPAIFDPRALKQILAVLDVSAGSSGEE